MALINSVVLVGNLTRNAEIRFFQNGNAIVKFTIAQNRRKKQGDAWIDEAMYFDISFGGKAAEALHKFLIKGKQVAIQGELRQDRWEQEGQARSKVLVSAFSVQLLGGRDQGAQQAQPDRSQESTDDHFEDDIPF